MKLNVLPRAQLSALDAAIWYDDREDGLGSVFLDAWDETLAKIETNPFLYGKIEAEYGDRDLRCTMLHRFPYVVVFQITDSSYCDVLDVLHSKRDIAKWVQRFIR